MCIIPYVKGDYRLVKILKKFSKLFEEYGRKMPTYFGIFFQGDKIAVWSLLT